jgi:hypothetical protein
MCGLVSVDFLGRWFDGVRQGSVFLEFSSFFSLWSLVPYAIVRWVVAAHWTYPSATIDALLPLGFEGLTASMVGSACLFKRFRKGTYEHPIWYRCGHW